MKFAYISTINSISEISSLGQIEFCLLPYVNINEDYKKYFKEAIKKKRYVIGDNLIAEGKPIKDDLLVQIAIDLKISEIIIPDVIGDYYKTKRKRESFLKKYYSLLKKNKIKIQSVIQGKTFEQYKKNLNEIEKDKRIDVIGIPFRMDYKTNIFNDLRITKELKHSLKRNYFIWNNKFSKPVHLLGCNIPFEMILYKNTSLRSMDSKLMARYGLNCEFFNYDDIKKPVKKLFLEDKMNKIQIDITKTNIKKIEKNIYGK